MMGKNHVKVNLFTVSAAAFVTHFVTYDAFVTRVQDVLKNTLFCPVDTMFSDYLSFLSPWFPMGFPAILLTPVYLVLLYLGSLFPDIDSPRSKLGRYLPIKMQHRSWPHSIWAMLFSFLLGLIHPLFWWFSFGLVFHILYDVPSRAGVCIMYPLRKYTRFPDGKFFVNGHWLKLYRAGDTSETVFVWFVCVVMVIVCFFCVVRGDALVGVLEWLF